MSNASREAAREAWHAKMGRVRREVCRRLGYPPNYLRTDVKPLHPNRFRVNVIVRVDEHGEYFTRDVARISDSFFVVTDANGGINSTSPEITRRYK